MIRVVAYIVGDDDSFHHFIHATAWPRKLLVELRSIACALVAQSKSRR
jgi:hypothetical protein